MSVLEDVMWALGSAMVLLAVQRLWGWAAYWLVMGAGLVTLSWLGAEHLLP